MYIFIWDGLRFISSLGCVLFLSLGWKEDTLYLYFYFLSWIAMERLRIDEKIFLSRFQESLDRIVKKPNFDRFLAYAG